MYLRGTYSIVDCSSAGRDKIGVRAERPCFGRHPEQEKTSWPHARKVTFPYSGRYVGSLAVMRTIISSRNDSFGGVSVDGS
jgi:hypothetical protein